MKSRRKKPNYWYWSEVGWLVEPGKESRMVQINVDLIIPCKYETKNRMSAGLGEGVGDWEMFK